MSRILVQSDQNEWTSAPFTILVLPFIFMFPIRYNTNRLVYLLNLYVLIYM